MNHRWNQDESIVSKGYIALKFISMLSSLFDAKRHQNWQTEQARMGGEETVDQIMIMMINSRFYIAPLYYIPYSAAHTVYSYIKSSNSC